MIGAIAAAARLEQKVDAGSAGGSAGPAASTKPFMFMRFSQSGDPRITDARFHYVPCDAAAPGAFPVFTRPSGESQRDDAGSAGGSVGQDERADALRFRWLGDHPDWHFIEQLCREFVADSSTAFLAGLRRVIDARRSVELAPLDEHRPAAARHEQKDDAGSAGGSGVKAFRLRGRRYVTQPGESVAGIALRELGDESRWRDVARWNEVRFPLMEAHSYYPVGTALMLWERLEVISTPATPTERQPALDATRYRMFRDWWFGKSLALDDLRAARDPAELDAMLDEGLRRRAGP